MQFHFTLFKLNTCVFFFYISTNIFQNVKLNESSLFVAVKYRHPQAFFNPNVRLNSLIQALDGAPNHYLDVPEGCHIHQTIVVRF